MLHVLPPGFVRVRYYGLLANADRTARLARCREVLAAGGTDASAPASAPVAPAAARAFPCPRCGGRPVAADRPGGSAELAGDPGSLALHGSLAESAPRGCDFACQGDAAEGHVMPQVPASPPFSADPFGSRRSKLEDAPRRSGPATRDRKNPSPPLLPAALARR